MTDLQSLRTRIEEVNLNLKTAHAARESESEVLTVLWREIRTRFNDQDQELGHLRRRTAELEDAKDELMAMVRTLLETVESTLEGINDGTVPQIAEMASELLATETGETASPVAGTAAPAADTATLAESPADPMPAPEATMQSRLGPHAAQEPDTGTPHIGESLSPGIRTLISRIEGVSYEETDDDQPGQGESDEETDDDQPGQGESAVAPTHDASPSPDPDHEEGDSDGEIEHDLREIEKLRDELQGLRRRIGTGT